MSSFRDFLFDRGRSRRYALALAMTGVRLGERLLMVGDDAPLAAQLAAKVGLTGRSVVVVGSEAAAARVTAAAAEAGVLMEDVRVGALPALPVDDRRLRCRRRGRGSDIPHCARRAGPGRPGPVARQGPQARGPADSRRGPADVAIHVLPGRSPPASTPSGRRAARRRSSRPPVSTRSACWPTARASGSRRGSRDKFRAQGARGSGLRSRTVAAAPAPACGPAGRRCGAGPP